MVNFKQNGKIVKTPDEGLLGNLGAKMDTEHLTLHTEILKIKFLVLCTGIKLVGVGLEPEGKLTNGGKVEIHRLHR